MVAQSMILFAVAPLAVGALLVAAGVIGGIFAIFRRKKTPELPPGVDDGGQAVLPFLDMRSGTTTAMLERAGGMFVWSVAGPVSSNGSDTDGGKAVVAMAEAMVASEPGATVTGSAGGPGIPTLDFGVQPEDDEWAWSVTGKSKLPSPTPGVLAPPIMLGHGVVPARSTGILAALAELSKHIDWMSIDVPGMDVVGTGDAREVHGIVISGDMRTVGVADLEQWIAFAAPFTREMISAGKTADEIMDETIADLPEDAKLNGQPIANVRKNVSDMLDMVRENRYVATASPDELLAALIVGAKRGHEGWWISTYKDHVILVRPVTKVPGAIGGFQGGGGGAVGKRFEYLIWEGGSRGYDTDVIDRGTMGPGKERNAAIRYAKQRVDQGFPGGGDAGGNQADTVNPDWNDPLESIINLDLIMSSQDHPGEISEQTVNLASAWQRTETKEIEVFDFAKGDHAKFERWRIGVGLCMRLREPVSESPFGNLSNYAGQQLGNFDQFKIRNSDANNGQIGPPPPVDFDSFAHPLLWKSQWDGEFRRGPKMIWTQGPTDITGTNAGEQVDPCVGEAGNWPEPSNEEMGFYVQQVGHVDFASWKPAPRISFVWKGTKLFMRIRYSGFPVFASSGTVSQALIQFITKFQLDLKIWTAGTNKE